MRHLIRPPDGRPRRVLRRFFWGMIAFDAIAIAIIIALGLPAAASAADAWQTDDALTAGSGTSATACMEVNAGSDRSWCYVDTDFLGSIRWRLGANSPLLTQLASTDAKALSIDGRLGSIDTKAGAIDTKAGSIDTRLSSIDTKSSNLTELPVVRDRLTQLRDAVGTYNSATAAYSPNSLLSLSKQLFDELDTTTFFVGEVNTKLATTNSRLSDVITHTSLSATRLSTVITRLDSTNAKLDVLHNDLVAVKDAIVAQGPNPPGASDGSPAYVRLASADGTASRIDLARDLTRTDLWLGLGLLCGLFFMYFLSRVVLPRA